MEIIDTPWKLFPGWMRHSEAEKWRLKIHKTLEWNQPKVKVYGKSYLVPRKTVFLGEKGINYTYSGFNHSAEGWPNWFYPLLDKVNIASSCSFNGCLVNLYRNGMDKMGWHSDNEKVLNRLKPITSLSLGSTRDFCIKHRLSKERLTISLKNGDLLIMRPEFQDQWIHSIPQRRKINKNRINLTFRCYLE
tara:strand:- start:3748 stop:4317 length:570 start_codon:yes stop_codon:yes gene_type:complete